MFLKLTLWGYGLQSPLHVTDNVSQPYSTTDNTVYIYNFQIGTDESVWTEYHDFPVIGLHFSFL